MNGLVCVHCQATEVEIVEAYADRQAMIVQCRACGKRTTLDTENTLETPNEAMEEPHRDPEAP